jgi:hypothetical protein
LFHISTAAPGEPFTYTLRVANTGMQVLDTLTITATSARRRQSDRH